MGSGARRGDRGGEVGGVWRYERGVGKYYIIGNGATHFELRYVLCLVCGSVRLDQMVKISVCFVRLLLGFYQNEGGSSGGRNLGIIWVTYD